MFPIITTAPDYGDEDDGPLMVFEDPPIPVENEVRVMNDRTNERTSFSSFSLFFRRFCPLNLFVVRMMTFFVEIPFSLDVHQVEHFEILLRLVNGSIPIV